MTHASQPPPIPSNYVIGEVLEEEDSFLSSVAQCLHQLRGSEFTSEMLRQECRRYVTEFSERCWLPDLLQPNKHSLSNIAKCAEEYSHSTGSNPELDGRIICNVFKVDIHILRKDHQTQLWSSIIMDGSGYRSDYNADYTATNTIHVIHKPDLQFRPILNKISKDDSDNSERFPKRNGESAIENYETRKGARGAGGHFYEMKLLMLFYLRLQVCDEFYLAANMANVGAFDDAVFKYKFREKDGCIKTKVVFLQAKHSDKSGVISIDSLLGSKGAFSLRKYFESFQTIKRNFETGEGPIFKECFDDCRFIIFTNYELDVTLKKEGSHISNPRRWLNCAVDEIAVGKEHIGKHLNPNKDINQDIIANLICNPIRVLAQQIYDYTLGGKKKIGIKVSNELLQKYHIALANKVFSVNHECPSNSKFSTKFNESESLWKEFCNIAGNSKNEEQFREDLAKVTINLHKKFGQQGHKLEKESHINDFPILSLPRPDEVVTEDEIKEFLTKLEFVLGQKNEKDLDEVIETEIQKTCEVNDKEEKMAIFGSIKSKVDGWWKSGNHFLTKQTKFIENAQTSISNFKLNVFESGFKTRIEKTGVQFNEIALDELKNIIHSHKTLNIIAEDGTTFLNVVKSYQTLQREFAKIMYNFMTVDHVLNIQDYVLRVFQTKEEIPYYLVIESNSELLANVQWAGEENIRSFYKKLLELTEQSSNKHVILITEMSHKLDFDLHKISLDICFGDLTDKSQFQLLDKVVTIQGMRVKIKELISWSDLEFRRKIYSKLIMSLIDDDEIVISNAPQRLCDSEAAYTKYYEELPLENFLNMISADSQGNTVIVISRLREKMYDLLTELLNFSGVKEVMPDHVNKRIDDETIIVIPDSNPADTLKEFQTICNSKWEKTIYWVEIDSELVRLQQVYYPNFYLKREFRKNVVLRFEVLCQQNLKEVFVFCTAGDKRKVQKLVNRLKPKYVSHFHANSIKNKIIFANNSQDAHRKCSALRQNISAHWLKVGGNFNEQLIWEKSQGSIDTLRGFIDIDRCKDKLHSEKEMSEVKDKVVVIADEPGMGKTTSLTSVSQQMMITNWVIRINFLDCEDAIDAIKKSKLTMEDFYKFVSEVESTGLRNDWAKLLVKRKLNLDKPNTWPILLLFDGFDEINKKRQQKVLPFLQFIKDQTSAKQWVTTRLHLKDILENGLSVFATLFEELSQKDRLEFLTRAWTIRLSPFLKTDNIKQRTEKYSSCLLGKVSYILGAGLSHSLGVPLQLRLLAEALRQDCANYMKSGADHLLNFSHVNIVHVYSHFIREKYEIYLRDKNRLNMNESLKLPIFRSFEKNHEMLAFNLVFPENDIIKPKRLSRSDEEMLKSVGIIQSIGMEGKPHFIHRTFAEFFVANLLLKYVGKKFDCAMKFLSNNIFEERNRVIGNFIHHMSIAPNEDFPVHFATFRNKLGDIIGLMKGTTNWNNCDKLGRTPLHIAAWRGHINVVKALLDSGCDAIAQDALGKTALHYAVMNRHVDVVEHILNYTADINICVNIFARPLHIDMEVGDSLFRDPEQLKSELLTLTNTKDIEGKAAVHYALEMNDWGTARMLIVNGANISPLTGNTVLDILNHIKKTYEEYEFGYSWHNILGLLMLKFVLPTDRVTAVIMKYLWAGHIKVFDAVCRYLSDHQISEILYRFTTEQEKMETICDEDHLKVSKYLMKQRKDKRIANRLANDAARLGNLETMKYVLSQGHKNDYISYMWSAVQGHNLNIVKLLEENFLCDDDGDTALHLAAYFNSLQIVKYLVENNADVEALNKKRKTPLDFAISFKNRIVDQYFRIKRISDYYQPQVNSSQRYIRHTFSASNKFVFPDGCIPKSKEGIAMDQSVEFLQEIHDIFKIFRNGDANIYSLKSMKHENSNYFNAAINCFDEYGNALLGYAASANDIDSVLFILRNGGSFELCPKEQGGTEVRYLLTCLRKLSESIQKQEYPFPLKYMNCLNKYNGIADVCGNDTKSFLHAIANTNSVNYYLLDYLVKHGANINALDRYNMSVITLAINSSNLDLVKFLLYKGGNIKDLIPGAKQKLFDCANRNGRPDITDLFDTTLLQQTELKNLNRKSQ